MLSIEPIDESTFHHRLEATQGVALVIFTGVACGACKRLRRVLADGIGRDDLQVFEVDAQRAMALAHEFGLFHLPAMHLYLDGRYHSELQAEATPASLRSAMEEALLRPAEEAP